MTWPAPVGVPPARTQVPAAPECGRQSTDQPVYPARYTRPTRRRDPAACRLFRSSHDRPAPPRVASRDRSELPRRVSGGRCPSYPLSVTSQCSGRGAVRPRSAALVLSTTSRWPNGIGRVCQPELCDRTVHGR